MIDDAFESREIDATKPSAARLYHYYLSGEAIFDIDRVFGEQVFQVLPYADVIAHHIRAFLRRSTKFMVAQGIRQFLDIGSGLPTIGNTHEVVGALAPESRVVYVDNDLEAVTRSHELLTDQGELHRAAIIEGDLRLPDVVLGHADTRRLLDFDEPIGLLIVSVWPFVPDSDRPLEIMARLRDALPAGSYVAMSQSSTSEMPAEAQQTAAEAIDIYDQTSDPVTMRSRAEFAAFYEGFELVDPGIVYLPDWRPEGPVDLEDPARPCNFAAVGYKG
ncbi:SAM-dependent methyltransferase [Nocardia albiluteola]|uniref:SAM-dependent methyltransferase n=1 Tax=Nocardia albiluteola TaxID=2842303 RepID=UPI0027E0CD18|nr:SAM-dependent methyltransferase [Nocardia albiluteola]